MQEISRKEAFECALTQMFAIIQAINQSQEKIYDYALFLRKNSRQPIIALQPLDYLQEDSYAYVPVTTGIEIYDEFILNACGNFYSEKVGTFKKFKASLHPTRWIREVLEKQYIKLNYVSGVIYSTELAYDSNLIFSKRHSEWILHQNNEEEIIYIFPYYTLQERNKILQKVPEKTIQRLRNEFWSISGPN